MVLEPGSRTSIGTAPAGWGGTMVIVSHEPELVRTLRPEVPTPPSTG